MDSSSDPCEVRTKAASSKVVNTKLLWLPLILLPAFLSVAASASSDSAPAKKPELTMSARVDPERLAPGEVGKVVLELGVPSGWHLWGIEAGKNAEGDGPTPLEVELGERTALEFSGVWHGTQPEVVFEDAFKIDALQYTVPKVQLERLVKATSKADPKHELKISAQICNDDSCRNKEIAIPLAFMLVDKPTGATSPKLSGDPVVKAPKKKGGLADYKKGGLLSFLLLAFGFGFGALATPCVFPAIPLTISFFSKYSEESFGRGARLALVYALTMIGAFTVVGVAISVLFGVAGIQGFAAHPVFNLLLAGVLGFFALNLMGMFEITPPAFLLTGVNKLDQKFGRTAQMMGKKKSGGITDYVVVSIAALTATTVFFTCTVGFVGLVLVQAAQGQWFYPTMGMLAFSTAFSLPFLLLAMFPQAARKLQGKGGNWLAATRVTLGFLELAAATKFLSNADLVWGWGLITRDLVLCFWIPLFAICGMFLLGKLRLGEEHLTDEHGTTGVGQAVVSMGAFGLAIFLASGLFSGKPFGGWVDGWLPPVVYPGAGGHGGGPGGSNTSSESLSWSYDMDEGRAKAKAENKLVFMNYTGVTCTNCRYMEGGMFPRPQIAKHLKKMQLVELYTDRKDKASDKRNREDQIKRFGDAALPFYSVELPDGTVVATFPSSTNDAAEFERFLADAIAKGTAKLGKSAKAPAPAAIAPIADEAGLAVLRTTRLLDGKPSAAVVPGKWTLINFWATWCAPCRKELEEFLVQMGGRFETAGGRFAVVAVDEDDALPKAKAFMDKLKTPVNTALRIPDDAGAGMIDPKLKFDGSSVPYTVLVSPQGEVVWSQSAALHPEALEKLLKEKTGLSF